MPNQLSDLHSLLSRTYREYLRGLQQIIGAPPGESPASLCSHLSLLRANAGQAPAQADYKQLVTDIADQLGLDWASVIGLTPWPELSSEQIEAAIVRHVQMGETYREEVPAQPRDVSVALDMAFPSRSDDWRKLLAAVIYIHQVIRPSAKAAEMRTEPAPESAPASGQHNSGNGTSPTARQDHRAVQPVRQSGDEPLRSRAGNLGLTLLDFWRWSASDVAGDSTTRAALAAYIVSCALGIQGGVRAAGEGTGLLLYASGLKIEVTTAVQLPSDRDEGPVDVRFPIRANRPGEASRSIVAVNLQRRADVFVFCLLAPKDAETVDALDVAQWKFYVVPSSVLDAQFPLGKSIRLQSVQELEVPSIDYEQLSASVESVRPRAPSRAPEVRLGGFLSEG